LPDHTPAKAQILAPSRKPDRAPRGQRAPA